MDDFEHLRRLSEAGVSRRLSSELVLTSHTDGFMVGETVYVGGTLPGKIAYIGETKFGSGDWAGVALERPYGKHDGTVSGHQYFQCEPRHGVFARLTRLTREALGSPPPEPRDAASAERSLPGSRRASRASPGTVLPPSGRRSSSPSKAPPGGRRSSSPGKPDEPRRLSFGRGEGDQRRASFGRSEGQPRRISLGKDDGQPRRISFGQDDEQRRMSTGKGWHGSSNGTPPPEHATPRPGDRVSVSSSAGRKLGTARYVGHADFADGIWIGISLDEPNGRNDGSVAGKRYFDCRPSYGLFAPLHRVTLVQRRPSGDLDRRRSRGEIQRNLGGADIDGYY